MAIAARVLSIFLALGGGVTLFVAVATVAGYRPYTGVGGAIIVDAVFGTVVLFGLGGVFTEVLQDVSFRRAPFVEQTAREMIE